jgi:hypothetical protein
MTFKFLSWNKEERKKKYEGNIRITTNKKIKIKA